MIESPCIKVCELVHGECVGCYRKLDEIVDWPRMDIYEKRAVLRKAAQRKRLAKLADRYG